MSLRRKRHKEGSSIVKFQVGEAPAHLVWVNDSTIAFSSKVSDLPPLLQERLDGLTKDDFPSYVPVSSQVKILNIETGMVEVLLNPYGGEESVRELFGNVAERDLALDDKKREFFDGKGSKIQIGAIQGAISITDLGVLPGTSDLYLRIGDDWYVLPEMGSRIEEVVSIPGNLISEQMSLKGSDIQLMETLSGGRCVSQMVV